MTFHGPTDLAPEVLRASDVFVHASHYEAFPIAVLEAMASGLPVAATFVGGLRDYLEDDGNALVCPPGDPDRLAAILDRLIRDPALRRRLGDAGLATVIEHFDVERSLDRYAALFDDGAVSSTGRST